MRSLLLVAAISGGLFSLPAGTFTDATEPATGQAGFGGNTLSVPVSSGALIVLAPESRDSLAAWSAESGVWNRVPVRATEKDSIVPIVANSVAAARVGDMVYGYGAESGKWHWIKLTTQAVPTVGNNTVTVRDGEWYYALSSSSGKWSGINLKTGEIR